MSESEDEQVPEWVLSRLLGAGYSPATLATLFSVPLADVRSVAPAEIGVVGIDSIETSVNHAVQRVTEEVLLLLDEASPVVKQRMVTSLFTKIVGTYGLGKDDSVEGLRKEMHQMLNEMSAARAAGEGE